MQRSIFQDIKHFFVDGNMVNRLIVVNIGITALFFLLNILFANSSVNKYLFLSNDIIWDIKHPWTLITHLFLSKGIIQFIWDMLILYWFGSILGDLIGDKKILPLYIIGGLVGALFFLFFGHFFYNGSVFITGASTSVLSIMVASAVLVPDFKIRLLLFGNVTLKIVVVVYVFIQFLYAISSFNPVYFSFGGGILIGWYYIYTIKKGKGLDGLFYYVLDYFKQLFSFAQNKQKRNLSVKYKSKDFGSNKSNGGKNDKEFQKELDRILDKIKIQGYEKLTESEKEFLFIASKRE